MFNDPRGLWVPASQDGPVWHASDGGRRRFDLLGDGSNRRRAVRTVAAASSSTATPSTPQEVRFAVAFLAVAFFAGAFLAAAFCAVAFLAGAFFAGVAAGAAASRAASRSDARAAFADAVRPEPLRVRPAGATSSAGWIDGCFASRPSRSGLRKWPV